MRRPTGAQEVADSTPAEVVEIDHEIFSTVILSLRLIQEGQLCFWRKTVHNTGLTA